MVWLLVRAAVSEPSSLACASRGARLAGASWVALAALACGGEDSTRVESLELSPTPQAASIESGAPESAVSPLEPAPAAPAEPSGPLYLVHSAVEGDEGRMNYFTTVDSLTAPRVLDYAGSLELPGRARVYAGPEPGSVWIGDAESMTLERRSLDGEGRLVPGGRLSLQALGVTSLGAQALVFVSPDKAYYKDAGQAQVIVIDAREMLIEAVLPLPAELVRDGLVTTLSDWAVRDGEAYFAAGWTTETYDRAAPGAVLVRVDTETDELSVSEEPRCRELSTASELDGSLYFFSGVINAFGHAVYPGEGGQEDCFLRVLPGERSFDPAFLGTLGAGLPARRGPTAVALTPDAVVWAQVADLDLAATTPGATYSEWYQDGWSWWSLPLAGTGARRIEQPPGAYSGSAIAFDGAFLISQAAPDYSQTTLVDLSSGAPRPGLAFAGFTLDVVPLR